MLRIILESSNVNTVKLFCIRIRNDQRCGLSTTRVGHLVCVRSFRTAVLGKSSSVSLVVATAAFFSHCEKTRSDAVTYFEK